MFFIYKFQDLLVDPWDVESPEDFLYYCCPECETKCQGLNDFKNHALQDHPRAHSLFFEDRNVARAAAEKLIAIQQNSSSPSTGTTALMEALSSEEASKENSKETPSVKDTNNTSEDANNKNTTTTTTDPSISNDEEEMDLDNSKPKCSKCRILCDITHTTTKGNFCGNCHEVNTQCLFRKKYTH